MSVWIYSNQAGYIDLENLKPRDVLISDIARGLSRTARYVGQTDAPYSVAEHSVRVMNALWRRGGSVNAEVLRMALYHDAEEAYTGDIVTPIKDRFPEMRDFCSAVARQVRAALGLPGPDHPAWATIHKLDSDIRHWEAQQLFTVPPPWYDADIAAQFAHEPKIQCLSASEAAALFLGISKERAHD